MRNILYTKNFNQEIKERVNVILSPEFYWIKEVNSSISLRDAKKIALSVLKLDEDEYYFDAFRLKKHLFVVALPKNLNLNIKKEYINGIYLAQIEFFDFDCIKLKNGYLQKVDNILFLLPTSDYKECEGIDEVLEKVKLSKKSFNYNINKKSLFFVFLIFLLINIPLLLNTISLKKDAKTLESETLKELSVKKLPLTSFELNSIYQNLISHLEYENGIKKRASLITKVPLKKGDEFLRFSFKEGYFTVIIKASKSYDFYFKRHFKVTSTFNKNLYKAVLK